MSPERLLQYFERISEAPDAIPRLRRFILDLAVRGKLVPQNPEDEPARLLTHRIEKRKRELAESGHIPKNRKTASTIEEIPLPSLPWSWEWVPIRGITVDRGQKVPNSDFTYIDVSAIDKEKGRIHTPQILSADAAPSRARKIIRTGDVIYSCVRPYLLNIAVVDEDFEPEPIASTAFAVLYGLDLVNPQYLWIVLRSSHFVNCVEAKMRGQAYPAINDRDFALLPVPLPPLAEQHRIVAKVDELMALCDELEAAQAKREDRRARLVAATLHGLNNGDTEPGTDTALDFTQSARFYLNHFPRLTTRPEHVHQLRKTILNLAVRGKLVPQDPDDEPAEKLLDNIQKRRVRLISEGKLKKSKKKKPTTEQEAEFVPKTPPGWALTLLGSAYDVRDGTHDTPKYVDNGYPLVTSKNLSSGRLDFDNVKFISEADHLQISERSAVNPGDVLLAMIGSIGNPVIVDTDRPFSIKNVALFKYFDPDLSCPGFLRIFLDFATIEMKQRAAGGLQPFVSLGFLRSYPLLLPPLAEQQRIVAKVDELMALCDELEAHLTTAATTRARLVDATLHEALNGAGDTAEAAMAD